MPCNPRVPGKWSAILRFLPILTDCTPFGRRRAASLNKNKPIGRATGVGVFNSIRSFPRRRGDAKAVAVKGVRVSI
jgi:hypothetical protein